MLGLLQRTGEVFIQILPNVQHQIIKPIITEIMILCSIIYADEYDIYDALPRWGPQEKMVTLQGNIAMTMAMVFMKYLLIALKVLFPPVY